MNSFLKIVLLFAVVATVSAQGTFQRFLIDDFQTGEINSAIIIPNNPSFPIEDVQFYTDSAANPPGLLGGERDLILAAETGPANRILTSNVGGGEWSVSTPSGASGFAHMIWDGKDASENIAVNGLGGIDFTDAGLGLALLARISSDIDTVYTFTVTSPNGNTCESSQTIPGTSPPTLENYYILYSSFTGNCDFSNVGAIDVFIEQFENVDSLITIVGVAGNDDPSPSRSPVVEPSASNSPGVSPSPSPIVEECVCLCPSFRCGVVYKQHDDDDDSVDDDTHDDDDLVYRPVYYGPVDDDFDELTGDDDEDEFISFMGGLTETGIHDDDDLFSTVNSAQTVIVSVSVALLASVLLL